MYACVHACAIMPLVSHVYVFLSSHIPPHPVDKPYLKYYESLEYYTPMYMALRHSQQWRQGGGVLIIMHGRSRNSYDHRPSHPYNAGTEHVGFSSTRQTWLARSAKRREVFGESHGG